MIELNAVIAPEFFLRLLVAVGLGALLGVERAFAHKTAGARTYALVCLGSAMFVLVGQIVTASYGAAGLGVTDPLRIASQIVVGIGFLGTGLIIFRRTQLQGLTTAAGLWVAAAVGMAVGFGLYKLAVFASLLTLFIFTVLWFIEDFLRNKIDGPTS